MAVDRRERQPDAPGHLLDRCRALCEEQHDLAAVAAGQRGEDPSRSSEGASKWFTIMLTIASRPGTARTGEHGPGVSVGTPSVGYDGPPNPGGNHDHADRPPQHRPASSSTCRTASCAGAHERDGVVANINTLVDRARAEQVPVVWVQHSDEGLEKGSDDWELVPELEPGADEPLVHKTYGDSFEDTDLESVLEQRAGRPARRHRCADRRVRPVDPARRPRPRVRRDPRRRRAHHRGPHRLRRADPRPRHRAHQPVLGVGAGAGAARGRRAHRRGELRRATGLNRTDQRPSPRVPDLVSPALQRNP